MAMNKFSESSDDLPLSVRQNSLPHSFHFQGEEGGQG
jgi:hypothetical protein